MNFTMGVRTVKFSSVFGSCELGDKSSSKGSDGTASGCALQGLGKGSEKNGEVSLDYNPKLN